MSPAQIIVRPIVTEKTTDGAFVSQVFGGVLMIAVGVALVTGYWAEFIDLVRRLFVSNTVMPI